MQQYVGEILEKEGGAAQLPGGKGDKSGFPKKVTGKWRPGD